MAEVRDWFIHPGPQPNGLQVADDGLWAIDQTDNHLYKLDWEDGSTLEKLPTETERSSGVTIGGGSIWITSTYTSELFRRSLDDGSTIARHNTPGKGVVAYADPNHAVVTGACGMEWVDDAEAGGLPFGLLRSGVPAVSDPDSPSARLREG